MLESQDLTEIGLPLPAIVKKIDEEQYRAIFKLRDDFVLAYRGLVLYDYQKEVSNAIIRSVLENKGETVVIEFSRQSGKTEVVCNTVAFLQEFIQGLLQGLHGQDIIQ